MDKVVQCDVLVIGAGPGGSSAAYWLARAGIDVLLCDKATFPRAKPCGDGLTPRAMSELERLGLHTAVQAQGRRFSSISVDVGAGGQTEHYSLQRESPANASVLGRERYGWVIPRRELDELLRQHSLRAGARFKPGFTARTITHCADGTLNVSGTTPIGETSIRARRLLVATGANRLVAHSAGLVGTESPQAFAMRGYVSGRHGLADALEVIVDDAIAPGYAWIFPLSDDRANIGVGVAGTVCDGNARMRRAFDRLLQHPRLAGCRLIGKPQGYPIRTDFAAMPTHADNVLLVGEAAGLVDPITGEGIGFALESGRLAAEAVRRSLADAADATLSKRHLSAYTVALRRRYAAYFADAHELLTRLSHRPVVRALVRMGTRNPHIRSALQSALLDERPHQSLGALNRALHDDKTSPLACALFQLGAYTSLIERCRGYMYKQVMDDAPAEAVLQFVRRGKMLRALLVFLGCEAAGGHAEHVLAGAGGIELVHAASLVHDDIMDRAATRRGMPAMHTLLGESRAIVVGDYLIAKAFQLLAKCRELNPPANVVEAFIIGAESGILACRGQFNDVGIWRDSQLSVHNYLDVVGGKTASVIAGALRAGAALAGSSARVLELLGAYGKCVGIAFQIRDDLLDFASTDAIEVMDRKPSLPLVLAFELAESEMAARARDLVSHFLAGKPVCASELHDLVTRSGRSRKPKPWPGTGPKRL